MKLSELTWIRVLLCTIALGFAAPALAQDAPPPPSTDLAKAVDDAPKENTTSLSALLGGTVNTGNTQAWQANAGADFLMVRMPHELVGALAFAYGRANPPSDDLDKLQTTVENLRTRARYDYFLTKMDALFVASAFRWDPFAGLNSRVQGEAGYARYFYKTDVHRFWAELGYDLTYDRYHRLPNPDYDPDTDPASEMKTPGGHQVTHSARLFVGYDNRLTESVSYLGGAEVLMNVEQPRDTRFNMDNALRSKIGGNFALEFKLSLQFDNVPVPGAKKLDTQTIASLIYNLI
jgi:putative salt-induced outer membrane protein YdiY